MGEQDRLGRLDVGRAGQDGVALALGEADERALERRRSPASSRSIARRVQSRRSVATWSLREPAGVELPADRPDPLGEQRLEVEVDVLEGRVPGDRVPASTSAAERRRARARAPRTSSSVSSPARPSPRTWAIEPGDVVERELGVDVDRPGEVRHPRIRLASLEPAAPEPHAPSVRCRPS